MFQSFYKQFRHKVDQVRIFCYQLLFEALFTIDLLVPIKSETSIICNSKESSCFLTYAQKILLTPPQLTISAAKVTLESAVYVSLYAEGMDFH